MTFIAMVVSLVLAVLVDDILRAFSAARNYASNLVVHETGSPSTSNWPVDLAGVPTVGRQPGTPNTLVALAENVLAQRI